MCLVNFCANLQLLKHVIEVIDVCSVSHVSSVLSSSMNREISTLLLFLLL